ncbi:50S ribosomal protein L10 [Conexibacter woesei]|uniref:Large ribosomal subunit protein uL10 n=1 Tax=Conexibacter woesei (strain DSM 14684 / CCUG 47730 / CIP 108061 / JCM 11494 / NBRC 100937 / ID131577) TaxID=469383 RepID=D3FET0_CONWI|nr:50S ribosomal protein L10 [Conexibacter woesei]ADB49754.1 ribosomal protein L10 [Conexibacter woesei DSM 14684]
MNRDEKAAVIDRIAGELEASQAVFAVDYRGITVSQVADLRSKLRESDTTLAVVKNSLTERAADKAGADALKAILTGPTALAFVRGDAAAAAKALSDAQRATQVLEFKGGLMDGKAVTPDEIRAISKLPSREVLYGQLVGVVAAPLNGLARGLNALIAGVAIQLQAIADQGLVGGNAPAPAAEAEAPAAEAEAPAAEAEAPAAEAEAPAAEAAEAAPAAEETAPAAAEATDTDSTPTTDDKTDDAAEADGASDAKED